MDVTDAATAARQRVVTPAELIRVPLRRWKVVLAVAAVVTAAAVGYLQLTAPTYTATAVVVVRPVVTEPFTFPTGTADRAVNMTAENSVANSSGVVNEVARTVDRTPRHVREALAVEVPVGGQVLRISYTGETPDEAVTGANTAAETYLEVREASYESQRTVALESYDSIIATTTDQRVALERGLSATGGTTGRAAATLDRIRVLNDQLSNLADQRARIVSVDLSPGSVASPASLPVPSSHDGAVTYLLAAAAGGLLLGVLLSFVRELADRRIRTVEQAADVTGLPLLGTVRRRTRRGAHGAEADVRYLAMAVDEWTRDAPGAPIVMLSPADGEGRGVLVAGLARALAGAGRGVYVGAAETELERLGRLMPSAKGVGAQPPAAPVDVPASAEANGQYPADGEVNGQHPGEAETAHESPAAGSRIDDTVVLPRVRIAGDDNRQSVVVVGGVSTMVGGEAPAPDAARKIETPVSDVVRARFDEVTVAAGEIVLGPFDRRPHADVLILDAPPAETDERGVRAAVDGVAVLVVSRDRTRVGELSRLVERVRTRGSAPVGFIITGVGHG
jgi:capsular polysaccharide biosynthesis protein